MTIDPLQDLKDLVSPLDPVELQQKVDIEFAQAKENLKLHKYDEAFNGFKFIFANNAATECAGLPSEMTKLATQHIPAQTAMKKWRDELEKQVFDGKASPQAVNDWSDLNQFLGNNERTLTGYHKLKDMTVSKELSEAVAWKVWKELVRVRRYEEIGSFLTKLESTFSSHVKLYDEELKTPRHGTPPFDSEEFSLKSLRNVAIKSGAPVFEVALALGQPEIAKEVFKKVTTIDTSDHCYSTFITSAIRAGADEEAAELFEQAKTHHDLFSLKETVNAMRKASIR